MRSSGETSTNSKGVEVVLMKAFLAGLGIGAGLGILFAPKPGERTRREVWGRLTEWSDTFLQQVESVTTTDGSQADQLLQPLSQAGKEQNDRRPSKKLQAKASSSGSSINRLSRDDLLTVNGIGPVLAGRIISGRPYASAQDLVDRGIIAQSTLDELHRQFGGSQEASLDSEQCA
jgi:DNA uptake protein ComE-like DNA-binding protein